MNGHKKDLTGKFSEAASTSAGVVHIVPGQDGWSVKKAGSRRATFVKPTKESAVKAANSLGYAGLIVLHKKDGTFQIIENNNQDSANN